MRRNAPSCRESHTDSTIRCLGGDDRRCRPGRSGEQVKHVDDLEHAERQHDTSDGGCHAIHAERGRRAGAAALGALGRVPSDPTVRHGGTSWQIAARPDGVAIPLAGREPLFSPGDVGESDPV